MAKKTLLLFTRNLKKERDYVKKNGETSKRPADDAIDDFIENLVFSSVIKIYVQLNTYIRRYIDCYLI